MNKPTTIEYRTGVDWTVEAHETTSVRYFNGRRYHTVKTVNLFSHNFPITHDVMYWTSVNHFVMVDNPKYHGLSFRSVHVNNAERHAHLRAMDDLIPDDNQAVPF